MAGRTRTTKKLAQRINREYFKKSFPLPRWRRALSIGLTAIGLLWLSWSANSGHMPYNAGPLALAHKIVTSDCKACHAQTTLWGSKAIDEACLKCHDAPTHQAGQTFTPPCADCHVEHRNAVRLTAAADAACTRCHADLRVKEGELHFARNIKSLADGHPEFAAVRPGHAPDPGTIKLNHQVHLQKGLRGPNGPVQLVCADCHRSVTTVQAVTRLAPAEMAPVNFEKHCMSCHPLSFDKRFRDPAPHKETAIVDAYVRKRYTDYIAQHPGEVHRQVQLYPELPARPIPRPPGNSTEWVSQRVEEAERLLWQKDCKECHRLTYPAPPTRPEVPQANETVHWMRDSWFDHSPHQLVACVECHAGAPKSQKTEDVLLPGIATCRKCHHEGTDAARTGCDECHAYHDWSKARPVANAGTIAHFAK